MLWILTYALHLVIETINMSVAGQWNAHGAKEVKKLLFVSNTDPQLQRPPPPDTLHHSQQSEGDSPALWRCFCHLLFSA